MQGSGGVVMLARSDLSGRTCAPLAGQQPSSTISVGILTFHRCINYGSYWQARCLAEGLQQLGCAPVLLEHQSAGVDRAEWRCALQPQLPELTGSGDRRLFRNKIRRFIEAFENLPLSTPFPLERPSLPSHLDLILVGSDEIWNLKHPWYGGSSLFFGEGLSGTPLAAYAASFGNMKGPRLDAVWAQRLRQFDNISVRDFNSRDIVRTVLGTDPLVVLDPCLVFPDVIGRSPVVKKYGPYAVVYGHSFPIWLQKAIRNWADRRGILLLSIGYRNDWVKEHCIDAGPDVFATALAGAEAVVTNFFHGCVFSLIHGKPFVCVSSEYRANKVRDLVEIAGARDHLIEEATSQVRVQARLEEPLDEGISRRLHDLRLRSLAYLAHVLA